MGFNIIIVHIQYLIIMASYIAYGSQISIHIYIAVYMYVYTFLAFC